MHGLGSMADFSVPATVLRIAGDELAYAVTQGDDPRSVSFSPSVAADFEGQSLEKLGFVAGTMVLLEIDGVTGLVRKVSKRPGQGGGDRNITGLGPGPRFPRSVPYPSRDQIELLPTNEVIESTKLTRAVPLETRKFGKVLDTRHLKPGDLLLTRDLKPEWTGRVIVSVQELGGYASQDARWSHAAMYLGDGAHVVEATFDSIVEGGNVRVTSLDEYAKGEAALRFRRPKHLESDIERWKLCVNAMMQLKKPYNFATAVQMWLRVAVRGGGFFDQDQDRGASEAVICSTLYADAYNKATRRSLGETSGACVPAWLSASDQFDDVTVGWLAL